MDQLDPIVKIIALTMGAAWASGINLYATILVLGLLGASGNMVLPPDLQVLMTPPCNCGRRLYVHGGVFHR